MSVGTKAALADREVIRGHIRHMLDERDLDAYIAVTPSNVAYVSGFVSYFLSTWWRMIGTVFVVLSRDEAQAPVVIAGDAEAEGATRAAVGCRVADYPMWVETRNFREIQDADGSGTLRPSQWRQADIEVRLTEAIGTLGARAGRIGTDLRFLPYQTVESLHRIAPGAELVDVTDEMYRIRSVKHPFEIARLAAAAELAEAGMSHAAELAGTGTTVNEVRAHFAEGVARKVPTDPRFAGYSELWVIPGLGGPGAAIAGASGDDEYRMQVGDLLKFDCGTTVDGYRSDHGRTFVLGTPAPDVERLYADLTEAHRRAVAEMRPGNRIAAAYHVAADYMRTSGYPSYRRGHFGHSLGLDTFHEEWPFIAPDESDVFRSDMVFAVETPFYGSDLGAIMIEDLVHVTADGPRFLTSLPRTLMSVGGR